MSCDDIQQYLKSVIQSEFIPYILVDQEHFCQLFQIVYMMNLIDTSG